MVSERVFAVRAITVKCRSFLGWLLVSALFSNAPSITAQVTVWTQHNDNGRSGWNSKETKLTPALLSATAMQNGQRVPSLFGKLFVHDLDDQSYSQPLYVPGLMMSVDKKVHNVVFVTTVNNSVYAFDADDKDANGGKPLWHTNVTPRGARPPNVADMNNQGVCSGKYRNFAYNMGIAGTPVIDVGKNAIYFVARTEENNNQFFQRIHALDIRSGKEILGGPKTIAAQYQGSSFNAFNENQRAALALVNGVVYVAWASHCDGLSYKGWILGFSASNLGLVSSWNDEPNGGEGGIWQAGQGPAADSAGNLYVLTGNGNWDPGAGDYGMSALKLHPTSQGSLSVKDYFTPMNHAELNEGDTDLGSAGALLVPGTHTLIGGGKEGILYVIDTNHMGHVNYNPTEFAATFGPQNETHHIHGSPIFFVGGSSTQYLYLWGENDGLRAFRYGGTQTAAKSLFNSPISGTGMPGGFLSGSSNGTSDGIVWALTPSIGDSTNNSVPGSLLAFDATKFAPSGANAPDWMNLLWSSDGFPARDSVGYYAKFTYPTVANGKVYVVGWGGGKR